MSTRKEQQEISVGGQKNIGSNRNNPDRVVSNRERVQHQVVAAHGVTDVGQTPDQHVRKHAQGTFESKGESGKREVKKSDATLGRHVSSKPGAQVSLERAAEVRSVRTKREKANFGK